MKTDLARILSVSGQHGLFSYVAQARGGVIVEALSDKKRTLFDAKNRISTMADIAIYTTEEEMKLQDVFLKMKEVLGDKPAPSSKSDVALIKDLFAKAVPNYDPDRFYVSHMKKVVDWYNEILAYASFDFVQEGEEVEEAEEDTPGEDAAND
ncbi:MAG: DUF5606 domain-containing protein [Bacteroidales bacterium]|nr:DUF5606 domain-containing protein [Bacteroidales bacterium]